MKEKIEAILVKYDPVKLIKMGAPQDEYSSEAQTIFDNIDESYSIDRIQNIIYNIFVNSFGTKQIYEWNACEKLLQDGISINYDDFVVKLIGTIDQYRGIAEDVKKILPAP